MRIIEGLITLGVAMVALKAVEKAKEKLDRLEEIDERTKRMEQEMKRPDYWNPKNWRREET